MLIYVLRFEIQQTTHIHKTNINGVFNSNDFFVG